MDEKSACLLKNYTAKTLLTGNPEMSEYFLAGLKLGGALMELSEISTIHNRARVT